MYKKHPTSKKKPILILHDLGLGQVPYYELFTYCCKDRTVILVEMPNISEIYPNKSETADTIFSELEE